MKQIAWAVVAASGLVSLGTTVADAAATCTLVKSMCPPAGPDEHGGTTKTSVPEPASLLLLGAGVSAVGAAIARRRKNKE